MNQQLFIIQKNSSILELGCGTGNLIGNLSPSYGIGVDISDEMVKIAENKYPRIKFVCKDVEEFLIKILKIRRLKLQL